jgi:hypothetical protein
MATDTSVTRGFFQAMTFSCCCDAEMRLDMKVVRQGRKVKHRVRGPGLVPRRQPWRGDPVAKIPSARLLP